MKIRQRTSSFHAPAAVFLAGLVFLAPAVMAAGVQPEQTAEAGGEVAGVQFSGRISAGFLGAKANEYVYQKATTSFQPRGHKNSELIWETNSTVMLGLGGSVKPLGWLTINADYWFNIGDGDATMDDYDWVLPDFIFPDWTDWSHHEDTDASDTSLFDLSVDMAFYSRGSAAFSGIVGYKHDNFKWDAYGGDFIYSQNGLRDTRGSFPDGLLVVSYEQSYDVPYFGLGFKAGGGSFDFTGRVIYSPWVSGESIDDHHLRNLRIEGDYNGGSMLGLDLAGRYYFNEHLNLGAGIKYQKYDEEKFALYWTEKGVKQHRTDGGMENEATMLYLSLGYSF